MSWPKYLKGSRYLEQYFAQSPVKDSKWKDASINDFFGGFSLQTRGSWNCSSRRKHRSGSEFTVRTSTVWCKFNIAE